MPPAPPRTGFARPSSASSDARFEPHGAPGCSISMPGVARSPWRRSRGALPTPRWWKAGAAALDADSHQRRGARRGGDLVRVVGSPSNGPCGGLSGEGSEPLRSRAGGSALRRGSLGRLPRARWRPRPRGGAPRRGRHRRPRALVERSGAARGRAFRLVRYGPASVVGRRSTYCSPTADTLRTSALRSAGIFGEVSSDEGGLCAVRHQAHIGDPVRSVHPGR